MDLVRLAGSPAHAAVLMRVKPLGARHGESAEWLTGQDIEVCPATIGDRVAFQEAFGMGRGVSEIEPDGKAAQEVRQVYRYASRRVRL